MQAFQHDAYINRKGTLVTFMNSLVRQ